MVSSDFINHEGIDKLPHFNPDMEEQEDHAGLTEVNRFRALLRDADGIILCTPEYAGGLPGVLKNALDWTVSSSEFQHKPVAVISASPSMAGGERAQASLLYTLTQYLQARIAEGAVLKVPQVSMKLGPDRTVTDDSTLQSLSALLSVLTKEIRISSKPTNDQRR